MEERRQWGPRGASAAGPCVTWAKRTGPNAFGKALGSAAIRRPHSFTVASFHSNHVHFTDRTLHSIYHMQRTERTEERLYHMHRADMAQPVWGAPRSSVSAGLAQTVAGLPHGQLAREIFGLGPQRGFGNPRGHNLYGRARIATDYWQ